MTDDAVAAFFPEVRKLLAFLAVTILLLAPWPALADGEGSVDNDGQALLVHFAQPVPMYTGGQGTFSEMLYPPYYALAGGPLGDASIGCVETHFEMSLGFCDTARILLSDHTLVEGQQYHVTFKDQDLGVFTAHGLADLTPPVVLRVEVSQRAITVGFSKPMRHDGPCPGWSGATPRSVGFVRGDLPTFSSPDDALEEAIATSLSAFMNGDCTAVTLTVGTVFPEGRFSLDVANVEDTVGNVLAPARFDIEIPDLGAPTLQTSYGAVQDGVWSIDLRFDEPLDPDTALDPVSYSIDGRPLPADVSLACTAACDNVHLEFAVGGLDAAIRFHELTYGGLRDPAGQAPEPLGSAFFPAY